MPRLFVTLLTATALLAACGGEPADTRPGQPVAHRRAAFKEIIKHFEPMGVMVRKDEFDANKFAMHTTSLMALRDKPWQYFGPDTQYPPSKAKDEVWSKPEEFESDKKAFFAATDRLVAITGTKDAAAAAEAFQAVEATCRKCHDTFKKR